MLFFRRGALLALLWGLMGTNYAWAQLFQGHLFYDVQLPARQAQSTTPHTYYIARVVDARPGRSGLGWLNDGIDNRRKLARFQQGLEAELIAFAQQFPHSADARPLVLVVRRLQLAEQPAVLEEFATAELVADFYYQQPDGYHLVQHATELTTTTDFDVTHKHAENIGRALQQVLLRLNGLSLAQAVAGSPLSWEQVLAGAPPVTYPVQSATTLRAGLYQSVVDFQQNAPQTKLEWRTGTGRGLPGTRPTTLKVRGDTPGNLWHNARDWWGFCDGKQAYVRHGTGFYPLTPTPEGYEYTALVYLDPRQQSTAIVYTPTGYLVKQASPLVAAKLRLWPDTGFGGEELLESSRLDAPADAVSVLVYRRPDAAPNQPVQLRLNGQPIGELRGGEYLVVPVPAGAPAEISLCGQTERETCFRFRPDLQAPNYLDCRLGTATQPAPTLRLVSAETGAAAVQECQPAGR